jgi:hypothetical protein
MIKKNERRSHTRQQLNCCMTAMIAHDRFVCLSRPGKWPISYSALFKFG